MRRIQLVDLDGCTADDRWRRNLIADKPLDRGPGWFDKFEAYHAASDLDLAANLDQIAPGAEVVVMTGRPLRFRAKTLEWLARVAKISPSVSLFRPDTDTRPSVVVKGMQLEWLLSWYDVSLKDIVSAIDDQRAIVEMYRKYGIDARIVRIGGEEHFHG
jgi:hypothetical protein